MTIQLEPGFWKIRNGHKVEILAIRGNVAIGYIHNNFKSTATIKDFLEEYTIKCVK